MCGRSSLNKVEIQLEERFGAKFYSDDITQYNPLPNFNVAPSHIMPIITSADTAHFMHARWGLIPSWALDKKVAFSMINARIETILEKKAFSSAFEHRRCLVPADGFYEWKRKSNGIKQPFRIMTTDQEIFAMAGLWDMWTSPEGEEIHSFTILTQEPNELVKKIHNRMPIILTREQEVIWLNQEVPPLELIKMIEPYSQDHMKAYPVSTDLNNVHINNETLINEVDDKNFNQLSLF